MAQNPTRCGWYLVIPRAAVYRPGAVTRIMTTTSKTLAVPLVGQLPANSMR